ncbi:MAG: hypothetical protein Q9181_004242 [Wetmoreana brouardii]
MATIAILVSLLANFHCSRRNETLISSLREVAETWSSFAVRVGTPAQIVRVLISTAGQATWVVSNLGCPQDVSPTCRKTRGELFNRGGSSTWNELGNYSLGLELNLFPSDNATYGLDTVALDITGNTTLENQTVAAISGSEYLLGTFGLGQQPTNLTNFTDPHPSFLTSLHDQHLIPSLSWSYTAGAKYPKIGAKEVFGSLTLGGYDAARFTPNGVSFDLAPDISRDLVVALRSITSTESDGSQNTLLSSAHLIFIDSTVPQIFLPPDACELFERTFGLVYNTTYGLYLVDDELHHNLTLRNPTFTFELGNNKTDGPTVDIALPYSSFALPYLPEFDSTPLRYFPIQRAANDSQLTLGRAFLQEAYVITDYHNSNFSVSQCRFEDSLEQRIMPIFPPGSQVTKVTAPSSTSDSKVRRPRLGRQETVGIIMGAVVGFLLLLALSYWLFRLRRRRNSSAGPAAAAIVSSAEETERSYRPNQQIPRSPDDRSLESLQSLKGFDAPGHDFVPEIAKNSWNFIRELPDSGKVELPENEKALELSHSIRSITPTPRPKPDHSAGALLIPWRRHAMRFSTTGILSPGNVVKYWMRLNGLSSQSESRDSRESSSTVARIKQSYLDRSLPPTPISESPQRFSYLAWSRVAERQHEMLNSESVVQEDPYQHRRGFF